MVNITVMLMIFSYTSLFHQTKLILCMQFVSLNLVLKILEFG